MESREKLEKSDKREKVRRVKRSKRWGNYVENCMNKVVREASKKVAQINGDKPYYITYHMTHPKEA
jgi:hypothetical protein